MVATALERLAFGRNLTQEPIPLYRNDKPAMDALRNDEVPSSYSDFTITLRSSIEGQGGSDIRLIAEAPVSGKKDLTTRRPILNDVVIFIGTTSDREALVGKTFVAQKFLEDTGRRCTYAVPPQVRFNHLVQKEADLSLESFINQHPERVPKLGHNTPNYDRVLAAIKARQRAYVDELTTSRQPEVVINNIGVQPNEIQENIEENRSPLERIQSTLIDLVERPDMFFEIPEEATRLQAIKLMDDFDNKLRERSTEYPDGSREDLIKCFFAVSALLRSRVTRSLPITLGDRVKPQQQTPDPLSLLLLDELLRSGSNPYKLVGVEEFSDFAEVRTRLVDHQTKATDVAKFAFNRDAALYRLARGMTGYIYNIEKVAEVFDSLDPETKQKAKEVAHITDHNGTTRMDRIGNVILDRISKKNS